MTKSISKHITFPVTLVELGEKKAGKLGFNLAEYIRFLLAKDIEDEIEYLDTETEDSLGKALEDVKNGNLSPELKSNEDIENYLNSLH